MLFLSAGEQHSFPWEHYPLRLQLKCNDLDACYLPVRPKL